MPVAVRRYRELVPDEVAEWERLVRKAYPPGEVRLGAELRWAGLDAETDYLIRFHEDAELRALEILADIAADPRNTVADHLGWSGRDAVLSS